MAGSFGPSKDGAPHTVNFPPEESPSGVIARTGTYNVRSRITDDDKEVYAGKHCLTLSFSHTPSFSLIIRLIIIGSPSFLDFAWSFKLTKEW